ncbi:MAG: esterase family protein [Acidobacteria bacterium]|nr:esterase family protein [Acidobacteriota bacterium]
MHQEYHRWYSDRLRREMGLVVYGHYGPPLLCFPTSGGNEWEQGDQSMIGSLAEFLEAGRVKIFSVNALGGGGFYDRGAHPFHRSWMQRRYDEYVREEVIPFIHHHCRSPIGVSTMGASLGAYYAANTLFKHPDVVKRCFAISGVYDMQRFMDGMYDDNFYFNNPVDYLSNLSDPWVLEQLATCDIHIVTGHGPWENSGPSYDLSRILASKGIRHSLDDWGPEGGHDWPYWKRQMREYLRRLS